MKINWKWNVRTTAGMLIGLFSPLLLVPLTTLIVSYFQHFTFGALWHRLFEDVNVQSKLISLSIIGNLAWFYFFLNRERWDLARGIIIGSAIYLPYIVYVNLIR